MTPNTLGNGEIIKIDPPEGELPTEMQGYVAREPVAYDGETIPTTEPMPDPSEPTHPGFEEALGAVRATMPTEKRQLNFTVNVVGLDKNSLSEPFLNSMLARLSNDNGAGKSRRGIQCVFRSGTQHTGTSRHIARAQHSRHQSHR